MSPDNPNHSSKQRDGRTNNVISFAEHQKQHQLAASVEHQDDLQPLLGALIWLYCPQCRTIEYTEEHISGGRIHRACGTVVEEQQVKLDLRAESTVAHINLAHLETLSALIEAQRQKYTEYLSRIQNASTQSVKPYPPEDRSCLKNIPVVKQDELGMLITEFLESPEKRFPHYQPSDQSQAPNTEEHTPSS